MDRIRRAIAPRAPEPSVGGMPWGDLYPSLRAAGTRARVYRPVVSIASTTSSTLIAPANPARRSLQVVNDGTATLWLTFGPVATASSFTAKLAPGATFVAEEPGVYQGDVAGVWSITNGSARVTEIV